MREWLCTCGLDRHHDLIRSSRSQEMAPLTLKGIAHPVPNFRPVATKTVGDSEDSKFALQFRSDEHNALRRMIGGGDIGVTIVLTGERGSGKSVLVDAVSDIGTECGLAVLKGHTKTKSKKGSAPKREGPPPVQATVHTEDLDGPSFAAWHGMSCPCVGVPYMRRHGDCVPHATAVASAHLSCPHLRAPTPALM